MRYFIGDPPYQILENLALGAARGFDALWIIPATEQAAEYCAQVVGTRPPVFLVEGRHGGADKTAMLSLHGIRKNNFTDLLRK
jgi:hypothetical protein